MIDPSGTECRTKALPLFYEVTTRKNTLNQPRAIWLNFILFLKLTGEHHSSWLATTINNQQFIIKAFQSVFID